MKLEVFLARRLSLKDSDGRSDRDRGRHVSAPGVKIAVAGIALSYVVMLLSVAVVTGFKSEIRSKVTGFEQQITISQAEDYGEERVNEGVRLDDDMKRIIAEVAPGATTGLTLVQPAMLKTENDFEGVIFKGLGASESDSRFIGGHIVEGMMPDIGGESEDNPIVLSRTQARALGLGEGDYVNGYFFIGERVLTRKLRVAGVYDTHFGDYDKIYVFAPLNMLQRLNRVDSLTGTTIEINGLRDRDIDMVTDSLRYALFEHGLKEATGRYYHVNNVNNTGAIYFSWLELLDMNVIVILILMGCVSGFTLVSSLFIIILQRISTIGLLKALGASNGQIRRIFVLTATKIVVKGLVWGNVIGLGILLIQSYWRVIPLDPESYYLNFVPVRLDWLVVAVLNVCVIAFSLALLIIPSQMISRLAPGRVMRYE